MRKFLIGISGKMGTGKTTMSSMILKGAPMVGERIAIAAPLYETVDLVYNKLDLQMKGDKDRDLMIALGLWGRNISSDFWLEQFIKKVEKSSILLTVCDDVRFPNEADYFEQNGLLIRIEGDQRGANVDNNTGSITETSLDDYPFSNRVNNSFGINDTFSQILDIILRREYESVLAL